MMALNSYTYGTIARVERIIGDIVDSRKFSELTSPDKFNIEGILDDVASEIHIELAKYGYDVKTNASLLTLAPRVQLFLQHMNCIGAAVYILNTISVEAFVPQDENGSMTRAQRLWATYKRLLGQINTQAFSRLGLTKNSMITEGLFVGSYKDKDGNINKPGFKRGGFDFDGTTDLIE